VANMYDKKEIQENIKNLLQDDEPEGQYKPFIILTCIICTFTLFQTAIIATFLLSLK